MAALYLLGTSNNGLPYQFPRLGTSKPLCQLSVKTITKSVRGALRRIFGPNNISVSCSATCINGIWHGKCSINGKQYQWEVY